MNDPEQIVERRTEVIFPTDTNHYHTLFGGKAVAMMDIVASIAAIRAARKPVVTASIDRIDFKAPVKAGEFAETVATVMRVGRTSITLRVELWAENPISGERRLSTVGTFVMVAVDREGRPVPIREPEGPAG
jgi:acyl-CoA hydrolase